MLSHRASLSAKGQALTKQVWPDMPTIAMTLGVSLSTIKSYFPDFSHWSGLIDWDVAAQYILASIFKSSESDWFIDSQFARNKAESIRTGRAWAAYHFYRDDADPLAQARHFVNTVAGGCNKYIMDVELDHIHYSSRLLSCLQEVAHLTGKQPVLYSSKYYWAFVKPNFPQISDYEFWTANYYTLYPSAPVGANVVAHQYEVRGIIPGVNEAADENFFYGSMLQMWEWFGNGNAETLPSYFTYLPIVHG